MNQIKSDSLVAGRFKLLEQLGSGGWSGTVWKSIDLQTNGEVVVKITTHPVADRLQEAYDHYLQQLRAKLPPTAEAHVALPYDTGQLDDGTGYQVLPYEARFVPLRQMIKAAGVDDPREAMAVVAGIARVLSKLHAATIIHADLKPSNILVSRSSKYDVRLIDFGMVLWLEATDSVQLITTYAYLHPNLARGLPTSGASRVGVPTARTPVGTFIDIYALGVITIELLTGSANRVDPPTESNLYEILEAQCAWISSLNHPLRDRLVNLIIQMLSVSASHESISASTISSLAQSLAGEIELTRFETMTAPRQIAIEALPFSAAVRINAVRGQIAEQTAALYVELGRPATAESPRQDEKMFEEIATVFTRARSRTQHSWLLGIIMTLASFTAIFAMLLIAVAMSIVTGQQQWALVFGGLGISSVVGTLIWKPYDRLFRATILAQQIEVIHLRVTAGLRSTLQVGERLKICNEAVDALQMVFREHAMGDQSRVFAKAKRKGRSSN